MISKEQVIYLLKDMRTEENSDILDQYISKINGLDDIGFTELLKQLKIKNARGVTRFVKRKMVKQTRSEFISLNDLVSFGVTKNTIHIHVVPKSIHNMMNTKGFKIAEYKLIDALEQIQTMLKTDERFKHMKQVFAVSPIIAGPVSRVFRNLNFDVKTMKFDEAKQDKELKRFSKRFEGTRDGKNPKYFGRAILSTKVILSEEWDKLKAERKNALATILPEPKETLASSLKDSVNNEITEEELKFASAIPAISHDKSISTFPKEI